MKKLTTLLLLIALNVSAQKPDKCGDIGFETPLKLTNGWEFSIKAYCDTVTCKPSIIYEPKYLKIRGDTLKGILYLMEQGVKRDKELYYAEKVIYSLNGLSYNKNDVVMKRFNRAMKQYLKVKKAKERR